MAAGGESPSLSAAAPYLQLCLGLPMIGVPVLAIGDVHPLDAALQRLFALCSTRVR